MNLYTNNATVPHRQFMTTRIMRRIAGGHNLNALHCNSLGRIAMPEPALLGKTSQEAYRSLGVILIGLLKIHFVAKENYATFVAFGCK